MGYAAALPLPRLAPPRRVFQLLRQAVAAQPRQELAHVPPAQLREEQRTAEEQSGEDDVGRGAFWVEMKAP